MTTPGSVIWHDLECGAYSEDLPLWLALATRIGGPILDVGAGTGRVTLELARAGHTVTALDRDAELLHALEQRARDLPVTTVLADARAFSLTDRFALCVVPMQTVQLLGGAAERRRFLRCARAVLDDGGRLAVAIADQLEPFEAPPGGPTPLPDVGEIEGTVYSSRPLAVRERADGYVLERRRETVTPAGHFTAAPDLIHLDRLDPEELEREGRALGFAVADRATIATTADYVGSAVVMLDA